MKGSLFMRRSGYALAASADSLKHKPQRRAGHQHNIALATSLFLFSAGVCLFI